MLKRKYHTTPLCDVYQQQPIQLVEPVKPSPFRALQITRLFAKNYWQAYFGRGRGAPQEQAVIWRRFFEDMGGLWIKIGQMMAMRTDLYSEAFTEEMASLQYRSLGFPFSYAKKRIEQSIGTPLEQVFVELEERPLAAASMSQIHKARLRYNGREVAVKVLRPYAQELLEADMRVFKKLFRFLSRFKAYQQYLLDDMIWELGIMLLEEVDFRYETKNLQKAKKHFKRYNIYVPKVYEQYCSDSVVVMEYIPGISMSEFIKCRKENPERLRHWIRENKIKPKKLGRFLLKAVWEQVFEDNFFHGDMQPGNIMLLRKSRLAFIDMGSIGTMDRSSLKNYYDYYSFIVKKDYTAAADSLMQLLPYIPGEYRTDLRKSMVRNIQASVRKASLSEVDIDEKTTFHFSDKEVTKEIAGYGIPPNWEGLKLSRVFTTLDPSVVNLNPKIKMLEEWIVYQAEAKERKKSNRGANLLNTLGQFSASFKEVSEIVSRNALEIKENIEGKIQIAIYVLGALKWILWITLIFLLWGYLYQHHQVFSSSSDAQAGWLVRLLDNLPTFPKLFWYGFLAFFVVLLWRFYKLLRSVKTRSYKY